MPVDLIDDGGLLLAIFMIAILLVEVAQWRRVLSPIAQARKLGAAKWWRIFLKTFFREGVYQQIEIGFQKRRWITHSLIMWGFVLLAVSTTLDFIYNRSGAPLPITSSVRISGNLGGLLFMVGLGAAIYQNSLNENRKAKGSYASDYLFLFLLTLAGGTGFLAEFASSLNFSLSINYLVYISHLFFVTALLITAPFTKFVHAIGRPILRLSENYRDALGIEEPSSLSSIRLSNMAIADREDSTKVRPDWGLERCITCYMCLAACPVYKKHPNLFLGPTGFVKLGNMYFNPVDRADRLKMASEGGVDLCDLNGYCQEVCPQHIQIVPIIRLLQKESSRRVSSNAMAATDKSEFEMTHGMI